MGRNKSRDHKYFNCSEEHEESYVSKLYKTKEKMEKVKSLLESECTKTKTEGKSIHYSTHIQVYSFIKSKLGYEIPD